MYFSEEKISEIIEKNDIVHVVSEYMRLKKSGSNYACLCPFHSEKTPSFSVSPSKQIFNCFGCGVGGNVVTFVQKIERMTYVEALRHLAEKAGIDVGNQKDEKEFERINLKNSIYKINLEAARFFYLKLKDHAPAMEYFNRRGIDQNIMKSFGLGFAQNEWKLLLNYLIKKGFGMELIYQAGLVSKSNAGSYYDKFRNRVIFPIIDLKGNVIAFGGRVMDDSKPKYLNSPESPVFSKGHNIYGLNYVKKLQSIESILVVEGYMDVIALHQHGFANSVASLGTAFTEHQAKLLKRFSNDIIIAYDSDLAGQAATLKGLAILEKEGCNVRVLKLPTGKDPDEYLRKEGAEAFKHCLDNSVSLIDYKIEAAKQDLNLENMQHRISFTQKLADILKSCESEVEVDAYIKKYSKLMQINESAIYAELNKIRGKHKIGNIKHNNIDNSTILKRPKANYAAGDAVAERNLLNLCIYSPDIAKNILSQVKPEDFSQELHRKAAELINLKTKEGKSITVGELLHYFDEENLKTEITELFNIEIPNNEREQIMSTSVGRMLQKKTDKRIQELTSKMNEYYQQNQKEQANTLFREIIELQKMRK